MLIISFFALACFYFVLTILGVLRFCQVPSTKEDTGILRWFYALLTLTCAMRLAGFALCSGRYANITEEFVDEPRLEEIRALHEDAQAEGVEHWLPLEPEGLVGVDRAPPELLLAIVLPEIAMVVTYFVLVWQTLAAYIDAHPQDVFNRVVSGSSDAWLIVIQSVFVLIQILLVTLYLQGLIPARVIATEITTIELLSPILVVVLILYYQCKLSGSPLLRSSHS